MGAVAAKSGSKKIKTQKFLINCKLPIEDNVIVLKDFVDYLTQRIKVENKTGNLGSNVTVGAEKDSIVVESKVPFSKKYLKKQDLKEFLRVLASGKNTYELRYFKIENNQ